MHHAHRDGPDGRPRQSASHVGDARLARLHVDGQGQKGVDQRDGLRARVLADLRHQADAGDVGRELHHQRTLGGVAAARGELIERVLVCAEDHASVTGVGAACVQLVDRNAGRFVEHVDHLDAVLDGIAEDVGNDHNAGDLAQPGQLLFDEGVYADVLQADGVHHSGGAFDDARAGVAGHRLA